MPRPVPPGIGQESVWDYPRPPRLEPTARKIRVILGGQEVAASCRALRLLETSHPPTYYIPPEDVRQEYFARTARRSFCEWKGSATYYTLRAGGREAVDGAWTYHSPVAAYQALLDHFAFYAAAMNACFVDDEQITPQPGGFYGGWITSDLVGPFKGVPGSTGW